MSGVRDERMSLGVGSIRAARAFLARRSGEWRNWQTRRIQVPVGFGPWGFKSPLAHCFGGHGPFVNPDSGQRWAAT